MNVNTEVVTKNNLVQRGIRIAHLSDLHCNGNPAWERNFQDEVIPYLSQTERSPDLLVITGDLVHHPSQQNYKMLTKNINDLCDNLSKNNPSIHIIPVPGNHDYFDFFGNKLPKIPRPTSNNKYNKALPKILYPGDNLEETVMSFFKEQNVGIFPMDSVGGALCSLAAGHIKKPDENLSRLDRKFQLFAEDAGINYSKCTKIILLHHHPLPVATTPFYVNLEPFMQLTNSHEFLEAACKIRASLILHGHKHVSGISQIKIFGSSREQSIIVSSCAATGWYDSKAERELKFINLSHNRSCSIQSHLRLGTGTFRLNSNEEIIGYGEIRKTLYDKPLGDEASGVEHARYKKKVVNIADDGNASIDLLFEGINWNQDIALEARIIREDFWSDTGRVLNGHYEFGAGPLWKPSSRMEWRHPNLGKDNYPGPDEPESFQKLFNPKSSGSTTIDCCRISYHLVNGFSLSAVDHEFSYPEWPEEKIEREEVSCIDTEFPTDFLHLIVTFPQECFPDPRFVRVEATRKSQLKTERGTDVLYGNYINDTEEMHFLHSKGAIKVHPELNTFELVIKYPQPDTTYILRWRVPEEPDKPGNNLSPPEKRKYEKLLKQFADPNSAKTKDFFNIISEGFKKTSLHIFLLGYDKETGLLKVIMPSEGAKFKRGMLVGRGPAGNAFKTKKTVWWEKYDEKARVQVEALVEDLDPTMVIALPLMYPFHINDERRGPVYGVLSIVAVTEHEKFQSLFNAADNNVTKKGKGECCTNKSRADEFVADIYELIEIALAESGST